MKLLEKTLFRGSKILLFPFFIGLLAVLGMYAYLDLKEIYHLFLHFDKMSESDITLKVFSFIDMLLIAVLAKLIITGSYTSSINKDHTEKAEKISSGLLKVKLATSILIVSTIHLLQKFFTIGTFPIEDLWSMLAIQGVLLITALVVAYIDFMHEKVEGMPHNLNDKNKSH